MQPELLRFILTPPPPPPPLKQEEKKEGWLQPIYEGLRSQCRKSEAFWRLNLVLWFWLLCSSW